MAVSEDAFTPVTFDGIDKLTVDFTHKITAKSETEMIRKLLDYLDKCKMNCGLHVYNDPIPFCSKNYNKLLKLTYWDNLKPEDQWLLAGHVVLTRPWAKYVATVSYWSFPDQEP